MKEKLLLISICLVYDIFYAMVYNEFLIDKMHSLCKDVKL